MAGSCADVSQACTTCLTSLLVPLVLGGVEIHDQTTLANCVVEHTGDVLLAGASPPTLTAIYSCDSASVTQLPAAQCPGRLPASVFSSVTAPCSRPELACTTCASAIIQPFLIAGWLSPTSYRQTGFSLADYEIAAACALSHADALFSFNVSLAQFQKVKECWHSSIVSPSRVRVANPSVVASATGGAVGGATMVSACFAFAAWRRRRQKPAHSTPAPDFESAPHSMAAVLSSSEPTAVVPTTLLKDDVMLLEPVGRGGQATVYRAMWKGALVAAKAFDTSASFASATHDHMTCDSDTRVRWLSATTSLTGDGTTLEVLLHELALLEQLRHPHVLAVYGMVLSPPILLMELAPLGSLAAFLHGSPPPCLSWMMRMDIAVGVASGVEFLHSQTPPFVHRDLKSANVILSDALVRPTQQICCCSLHALTRCPMCYPQTPKLCDFGISCVLPAVHLGTVENAVVVGTPAFMAPEVALGLPLTLPLAVDVYGVGVVLHDLSHLAMKDNGPSYQSSLRSQSLVSTFDGAGGGAAASNADTAMEIMVARRNANFQQVIGEHVPAPLSHVLACCLAVQPARRPDSSTLRSELERMRADEVADWVPIKQ